MKEFFRRCLAIVMVLSMLLGTGITGAFAVSADSGKAPAVDVSNAIIADPSQNYALAQDILSGSQEQISSYEAEETVTFLVELEGKSLLDTKPASQTMGQYMTTSAGTAAIARIELEQVSVQSYLEKNRTYGLTVDYTYQVVMNGFAVTGPYSMKSELEAIPGVSSVTVAQTYTYEEPVAGYTALETSGSLIDSDDANTAGYTGKGTVTAILDTGLELTHEAFAKAPEDPAMDLAAISAVVSSGKLNATASAEDLYKSAKIPFAYDYTSGDADVTDPQQHGTHVAGTIGANGDNFSGVAPDTQLVIMKVFTDEGGGATDAVIFAALEDAVILGVDAINMSLGTPSGFTSDGDVTDAVYSKIQEAGINLMVSAGNETSATYYNNLGTNLPLVSEPDNGIVGSPSTYSAAMSVASINEYEEFGTYLLSGDAHILYNDANVDTALDFVKTFNGQTLEYVYVPAFGSADDFAAVDVSGKIALVARGELAFTEKEQNAYDAGAVGIIVFDNVEGDLIYMQGNSLLPMVFISKASGLALRDQETKTISVSEDYKEFNETTDGGLMSSFSSLGVAPDLTLKPEITAPGGYVYSTLPGNTYGSMSGTSMASPHMAGAAAVMQQYVNEKYPDLTDNEKQALINTLLMNTAVPVEDENGVAYTPRKQGSGLAQVNSAIHSGAYVTVEGSNLPKAELGDSANGYFSKEVTLTIHNVTDADLTYQMSSIALTAMEETVSVSGVKYNCISENSRVMPESEFQVLFSEDVVTVPAGSTATVSVKLRLTEEGEASLADFVNGTFLDGFIVLESQDSDIDLSVPYLGFYGDWGQASVFDDSIYEEETASVLASSMALLDLSTGNGHYLGSNMFTDGTVTDENKIAVSREMLSSGYRPFTMLGLLRAPKSLTYTITDANGNAVEFLDELTLESLGYSYTTENIIKSFYYASGGYINYELGPTYYGWLPAQDFGGGFFGWLDDGQYYIQVAAQVDGTDSDAGTQSITFPITIDSQAPQLLGTDFEEVDGTPYVTLDLYDNEYIMAFQIISADGLTAFSPVIPVDEDEAGTISSFTFDTSALLAAGYTSAVAVVYDYALNDYVSYEFSLESDTLQPASVTINNSNITCSGAQTFEIEAWVEPEGLEDMVLTWTSSDESVATVRDTGKTRYDADANVTFYIAEVTTRNVDGEATITVTTANGKSNSTAVKVTASYTQLPEDYVIRKDGTYLLPADLHKTTVTITDDARNVVIVGNPANTADAPYNDLYLKSEISEGLNLTILDLNVTNKISSSWGTPKAAPVISFTGTGNKLILEGENTLVGVQSGSMALIEVNNDAALTIDGTGTLNLTQPLYSSGAAIGNSTGYDSVTYQSYTCGDITINGGKLNITVEGNGAGIGGSAGSASGDIVINGGDLDIDVIGYGAGIGGGNGGGAPSIVINGGNIGVDVAYAMAGYSYNTNYAGAGIGGGNSSSGEVNVTIHGGSITASTATNSAAIGSAYLSWGTPGGTTVTIHGGKVVARTINGGGTASSGGAAIGTASNGGAAAITVNGGEVIAVTETAAAAIGSGYYAQAATITVNGGTVSALANSSYSSTTYHGAAIGKGAYATAGYLYVNGGAVLAVGNADPNLNVSGTYNNDYEALTEVTLNIPGIQALLIDGVDWKVSCNHTDFTGYGGNDYSEEVHVWLPETTDTPYVVTAQTGDGTAQYELYTNGNLYEFHTVTYDLTGIVTDGPAKVYDPSAGDQNVDLTGTLSLISSTTSTLPTSITVTVDGAVVDASYDASTGVFTVAKELLTGDVVITAAAVEVVDKTSLNNLIAQVEAMDPTLYTGSSWSALAAQLESAKAVADADATTQAAVDAAYEALLAAMNALEVRADISALEVLIAEADKKAENEYVSDTWAAFAETLANAKAVAANTDATQTEVDEAAAALSSAMEALIARGDKTELRKLIDEADVLFESNYTPDSWSESGMETALEEAIAVYTDPDATQEEVDDAVAALRSALDKLMKRSDFSALLAMIRKAEALDSELYTTGTWSALEKALADAREVAKNPEALQTEIDAATAALEAAIADLALRGDTTELEQLIEEAEALNEEDYTPGSWDALVEALEEAKKILEDSNATQEDVDAAAKALLDAMAGLYGYADKTDLQAAYDISTALVESAYTAVTWKDMASAIANAKTVLDDPNATQAEVDAALEALRTAAAALVRASHGSVCDGGKSCPSARFTDVSTGSWYHADVDYMVENGYILGVSETEFGTYQQLSRAQLVTMLYRIAGSPSVDGLTHPFTDVVDSNWYGSAVIWAYNTGIIKGVSETSFDPYGIATRAQVALILYRMEGSPDVTEDLLDQFSDGATVSAYARDAMNWAVANGIIKGFQTDGKPQLQPSSYTTRAEAAAILHRLLTL